MGIDRWWVLGDLVLVGPYPVDVAEMLAALPVEPVWTPPLAARNEPVGADERPVLVKLCGVAR